MRSTPARHDDDLDLKIFKNTLLEAIKKDWWSTYKDTLSLSTMTDKSIPPEKKGDSKFRNQRYKEISEENNKIFETEIWEKTLYPRVNTQIDLYINEYYNFFLTCYPWAHALRQSALNLIKGKLLAQARLSNGKRIEQWNDMRSNPDHTPVEKYLTWAALSPEEEAEFKNQILLVPFSNVKNSHCNPYEEHKGGTLQHRLESAYWHHSSYVSSIDYRLSHVDLIRYLHNHDTEGMNPKTPDGEKTKPYNRHTLSDVNEDGTLNIPKAQWSKLQTVLINLENKTEKDTMLSPLWIALHKTNDQWIFYLPKGYASTFSKEQLETFEKLRQKLPVTLIAIVEVDYSNNQKLTHDFGRKPKEPSEKAEKVQGPIAEWHDILFGRVLPWFKTTNGISLPLYRKHVPVHLLHQQVQRQCFMTPEFQPDEKKAGEKKAGEKLQLANELQYAYTFCYPFSPYSVDEIGTKKKLTSIELSIELQLSNSEEFEKNLSPIDNILLAFDQGRLTITQDKVLQVTNPSLSITDALYMIYHHDQISCLTLKDGYIYRTENKGLVNELFTCDTHLKVITVENKVYPTYPMHCVARNRFLTASAPKILTDAKENFDRRRELWSHAGSEMIAFYRQHGQSVNNVDWINQYMLAKKGWREHFYWFDNIQTPAWQFAQIAEMGSDGLAVLFKNLSFVYPSKTLEDKNYAPQLACAFDLNGGFGTQPTIYINDLINGIQSYEKNCKQHVPLFSSLSLIVPDTIDNKDVAAAFLNLIGLINQRSIQYPEEVSEINLFNVNIKNKTFISTLMDLVKKANLQVQINIPAWDIAAFTDKNDQQQKAQYKLLQNAILANQQKIHDQDLEDNADCLLQYSQGKLSPDVNIAVKLAQKPQVWDEKEEWYPLGAQSTGIQQQQQQQQQIVQMQEEAVEINVQKKHERQLKISHYDGQERDLITRDNIDQKYPHFLNTAEEMGLTGKSALRNLFSLWVGSGQNAENVIEKIEPAAVEKLNQYASHFRLGIDLKMVEMGLVPGFYLATLSKNRLVLRFSEAREKQDLIKLSVAGQANPFQMILRPAVLATPFKGDLRQLAHFFTSEPSFEKLSTLWRYLAQEDTSDNKRFENAKQYISRKHKITPDHRDAAVMMQVQDINQEFVQPLNFEACLKDLQSWAEQCGITLPLFDPKITVLEPFHIKAFAQLFNHYSIATDDAKHFDHAGKQWLYLAEQIWQQFGEKNFKIWKKRFLDVSKNWCELIEKEEVEAIAKSIVTLKENDELKKVWWQLIDKHGEATRSSMRYADLWNAFSKVLSFIEEKKLTFKPDILSKYLDKLDPPNFNALVFFSRLYQVLEKASMQLYARDIQQTILDNIHNIDWQHNGFYYASCYENYPYWDKDLHLTSFTPSVAQKKENSYIPTWSDKDQLIMESAHTPIDTITHALRFASTHMQLNIHEFEHFKTILTSSKPKNLTFYTLIPYQQTLRLLTACLTIGTDTLASINGQQINAMLEAFNSKKITNEMLSWVNELLDLDKVLTPHTFTVKFEHLPALLENLYAYNEKHPLLKDLTSSEILSLLNACGRARQVKGCDDTIYSKIFTRFMEIKENKQSAQAALNDLLIRDCPWLLGAPEQDLANLLIISEKENSAFKYFKMQLRSIDVSNPENQYLPDHQALHGFFNDILTAADPHTTRRKIIQTMISKGCHIVDKDFAFRPLDHKEKEEAKQFFESHLKLNFKKQNLMLCEKLLEKLAIQSDTPDVKKKMEAFLTTLLKIDNKDYFDELGRVIGTLLAKNKGNAYYSIGQLNEWLNLFGTRYHRLKGQHYPIKFLNEIIQPNSTLLNQNLDQLEENSKNRSAVKNMVESIVNTDLPSSCKSSLIKMLFKDEENIHLVENIFKVFLEEQTKPNPHFKWLQTAGQFFEKLSHLDKMDANSLLKNWLTTYPPKLPLELLEKHFDSQIKLMNLFIKNKISSDLLKIYFSYLPSTQIIISQIKITAGKDNKDVDHRNNAHKLMIDNLADKILKLSRDIKIDLNDLNAIADRAHSEPFPSVQVLDRLLDKLVADRASSTKTKDTITTIGELFDYFERVEQARYLDNGEWKHKYHYSLSTDDKKNLQRILRDIKVKKVKGQGYLPDGEQKHLLNLLYYCNHYSEQKKLHELSTDELQAELNSAVSELGTGADEYASARLLACMRMVLLRKTGKWANHTQMMALLYAARYNSDNLIHQMRTGEGKSLITNMRTAYLVFTGHVVDVFTAKASLSQRDVKESMRVYDFLGIEHSYITPNSPIKEYKTGNSNRGAVNFMTVGDFSLFLSRHHWEGSPIFNLDPARRVAWIDELDHVLKNEQTQFNFSAPVEDNKSPYNLDEWIYRATYEYYLTIKKEMVDAFGHSQFSSKHLRGLCEFLQYCHAQGYATKGSRFFETYLYPALPNARGDRDPAAMEKRNQELARLLTAAFNADHMKLDDKYCVLPETQKPKNLDIDTHFASVMIDAELKEGSTYTNLCHQFLHSRLNEDAVKEGNIPDFFVEPETQITLSQNVRYIINTYYGKREGCTATVGSDLNYYAENYGIDHVVKIPTHLELGVEFLPSIYCDNFAAQVNNIVEHILKYKNTMPTLIHCQNDAAVKNLSKAINARLDQLRNKGAVIDLDFYVDTNDTGISENEVTASSGRKNRVTISSRMGRGTDIKLDPDCEDGLFVLRTYPAPVDIEKQEEGRGGRNGAKAKSIDIINYEEIQNQYTYYSKNNGDLFNKFYHEQNFKLENKIKKQKNSPKKYPPKWWSTTTHKEGKDKYLTTRTIVQLNEHIKNESEKYLRAKELLISRLTGEAMKIERQFNKNNPHEIEEFNRSWVRCYNKIELAWGARLKNQTNETLEIYKEFITQANQHWQALCTSYPILEKSLCQTSFNHKLSSKKTKISEVKSEEQDMPDVLEFYQRWLEGAEKILQPVSAAITNKIYGNNKKNRLAQFYQQLLETSSNADLPIRGTIFTAMIGLSKKYPNIYGISTKMMTSIIAALANGKGKHPNYGMEMLSTFLEKTKNEKVFENPKTVTHFSKFAQLVINIASQQTPSELSQAFLNNFMDILYSRFWPAAIENPNTYKKLAILFTHSSLVTNYLTNHMDKDSLETVIEWFTQSKNPEASLKQVEVCVNYINEHHKTMDAYPFVLESIFNLTLHPCRDEINDAPPPPNCVEKFDEKIQRKFWHFLSSRPVIKNGDYSLVLHLMHSKQKEVVKSLLDLPSMSLTYIVIHIKNAKDHQLIGKISELKQAGKVWNKFMQERGIIEYTTHYSPKVNQFEKFKLCSSIFESMHPVKAYHFFKKANQYKMLPLEKLAEIAKVHQHADLHDEEVDEYLTSRFNIAKIMPAELLPAILKTWSTLNLELTHQSAHVLQQLHALTVKYPDMFTNEIMTEVNKEITKERHDRYENFFTLLNQPTYQALEGETILALYQISKTVNKKELEEAFYVVNQLSQLKAKYPEAFSEKDITNYFDNIGKISHNQYENFFTLLNQPTYQALDAHSIRFFYDYYLTSKMTKKELEESLTICKKVEAFDSALAEIAITMSAGYRLLPDYLTRIKDTKSVERVNNLFNDFFKIIKQPAYMAIPKDIIERMARLYFADGSTFDAHALTASLNILNSIIEFLGYDSELFKKFIALMDDANIRNQFADFFSTIKHDYKDLDLIATLQLTNLYFANLDKIIEEKIKNASKSKDPSKGKDRDIKEPVVKVIDKRGLAESLKILERITNLPVSDANLKSILFDQFMDVMDDESERQRFIDFLNVIDQHPEWYEENKTLLAREYLIDKTIMSHADLIDSATILHKISQIDYRGLHELLKNQFITAIGHERKRLMTFLNVMEQHELDKKSKYSIAHFYLVNKSISDEAFTSFFNVFDKQFDKLTMESLVIAYFNHKVMQIQDLQPAAEVFKKLKDYAKTHPNLGDIFKKNYMASTYNSEISHRLDTFLTLMSHSPLTDDVVRELYKNYVIDRKITYPQLDAACRILHESNYINGKIGPRTILTIVQNYLASRPLETGKLRDVLDTALIVEKLKETDTHPEYFSLFLKNKTERKKIMQFLTHDLLGMDHAVTKACQDEYKQLALKILKFDEEHLTSLDKRKELHEKLQRLIHFTKEIEEVASSPFPQANQPSQVVRVDHERKPVQRRFSDPGQRLIIPDPNGGERRPRSSSNAKALPANNAVPVDIAAVKSADKKYFKDYKKNYNSFWNWDTRKTQMGALYTGVKSALSTSQTLDQYYQNVLTTIWITQNTILDSDLEANKDYFKKNTKGYSRLYDICTAMFVKISRDYLSDKTIPLSNEERGVFIHHLLQTLLVKQIQTLKDYAANDASLPRQVIDNLQRNDLNSLKQLKTHWHPPKHLKYIKENISNLMALLEEIKLGPTQIKKLNK